MHIYFVELTDVQAIAEGGFGIIYRAKHPVWGIVVYKELKASLIIVGSRLAVGYIIMNDNNNN